MPVDFRHRSLADISERQLVERLVEDPRRRADLFALRGMPRDPIIRTRVDLTGLPGSPKGDVDILAWAREQPAGAVAIEVKRIKAVVSSASYTKLNKLQEFEKGVRQANALARIGFSQVYLWIFVAVDSRERNGGKITYDGLTPHALKQVEETISVAGLDARIGLIHHQFVQPMDNEPLAVGVFGGHLIRLPERSEQPAEVTAWVEGMASEGAEQAAADASCDPVGTREATRRGPRG